MKSKLRGLWETRWNAEKPLHGVVSSSGFSVQISPSYGRGFNPYFVRGVFTPGAAGTTIRAGYGVRTSYRLFVAGLVSFFSYMMLRVVSYGVPPDLAPFFGGMWCFIALFTYWRAGSLIRRAEMDRDLILGAVVEILDAQVWEVSDAVSGPR